MLREKQSQQHMSSLATYKSATIKLGVFETSLPRHHPAGINGSVPADISARLIKSDQKKLSFIPAGWCRCSVYSRCLNQKIQRCSLTVVN